MTATAIKEHSHPTEKDARLKPQEKALTLFKLAPTF